MSEVVELRMLTGGRPASVGAGGPGARVTHPAVGELPDPAPGGPALHLVVDEGEPVRIRVVDGLLRCLSRQGLRKTTVNDIARESGLSRATLYRHFPGGRDAVVVATAQTEVARFFSALAVELGAAEDLEDLVVTGLAAAARQLSSHRALAACSPRSPRSCCPG